MLRRRRPLLFSAPAPPSPESRSGRGGTERPPAAQNGGGGGGRHCQRDRPAPGELPGAEPQLRRPHDARRRDAGRAAAAASPAGFLFLSELFSPTPLLLLLAPPLPPPRTLRAPRAFAAVPTAWPELLLAEPLGPLGEIFGPGGGAHWAKGSRGAWGQGGGGQSGSGGRGRSPAREGRL